MKEAKNPKETLVDEHAHLRKRTAEPKAPGRRRKRDAKTLRGREERLADFFLNAPVHGFLLLDSSFRILAGNDLVLDLFSTWFGMKKEEIPGRNFLDLIPGFRDSDRHRQYLEVLGTGIPFTTEAVVTRPETGNARLSVVLFKAGDGLGIIATDITERKRAEEALRESEGRLRAVMATAPDGIGVLDLEGKMTYVSPRMIELYGFDSAGEILGRDISEFVAPEDRARVGPTLRETLERGFQEGLQYEFLRKDGSRFLGDVNLSLLRISGQEPHALIGIVRDVSERVQALEALRKSEERYRVFFEEAPTALWEIDASYVKKFADGLREKGVSDFKAYFEEHPEEALRCESKVRLVELNKASADLFGAGSKEELLASVRGVLPKDTSPPFSGGIVAIAEGRTSFERQVMSMTLAGRKKYVFYRWSVLPGCEQTYARLLVSLVDITDRVLLEQELLKSQKLESLGLLAGGIAHDFNNLLTAISTNISMAKMYGRLEDDISEMLEDAEKASRRARNLTQQLLAFAKGGKPFRKTVSLRQVLRDAAEFALSGSNVRSEYLVPADLWPVFVDEGQIAQVIQNLAINADQAMPAGGKIEISAANVLVREEDPLPLRTGRYVRVSVEDHGIGISKRHLNRIFDPFFTTKQKGSGLGLATSFTIIRNHGGHIRVHSEVDVGSRIDVFLPASEGPAVGGEEETPEPLTGEGRILLIDDEEAIRRSAGEMLRRFGYEVRTAEDGDEGLRSYRDARESGSPFDAVIVDLTVRGGKGGKETVEEILEMDPDAKVIVSSGYSEDPVMSDYLAYGFRDVITKPYRIEEVGRVLRRVVSGGGA